MLLDMSLVHHDIHIRKRIYVKKQKYPSNKRLIAFFDKFIIVLGVVNIIATIPQLLQIWVGHNADGVSFVTWAYYAFFSLMMLMYGLLHRELPIILNYSSGMFIYILIAVGAVIY